MSTKTISDISHVELHFFFYMAITNYFISHYFDLEALTTFSGAQTSNATALSWDIFLRYVLIFKSFTPVLDLRYPQAPAQSSWTPLPLCLSEVYYEILINFLKQPHKRF